VSHQSPGWERVVAWLVVAAVVLQLLASTLPRLVIPLAAVTVMFVIVRLVLFHTRKW
jgi:uncharacterized membrane protein YhhN